MISARVCLAHDDGLSLSNEAANVPVALAGSDATVMLQSMLVLAFGMLCIKSHYHRAEKNARTLRSIRESERLRVAGGRCGAEALRRFDMPTHK